jgi:hypothetical protein
VKATFWARRDQAALERPLAYGSPTVILRTCVHPSVVDLSGGSSYPRLLASAWQKLRREHRTLAAVSTSPTLHSLALLRLEQMQRSAIRHLRILANLLDGFVKQLLPDELVRRGKETFPDTPGTVNEMSATRAGS